MSVSNNAYALIQCTPLIEQLRGLGYQHVNEMLNYNAKATVQYMINFNAVRNLNSISPYRAQVNMQIQHHGTCPQKTWLEYRDEIIKYMRRIVTKSELSKYQFVIEPAVKTLADYFWTEYYRKYPYWPSVGCVNEADIYISITNCYRHPQHSPIHVVIWNCTGYIHVKDSRPQGEYRASLNGTPDIKIVFVETSLLNQVNQRLGSLGRQAIEAVNDAPNHSSQAALDWRRFY